MTSDAIAAISHDDIVSPTLYANERAFHAMLATLRREAPVRWTEPTDYRPFWAITRHADILELERRADVFKASPRNRLITIEEEQRTLATTGTNKITRSLPTMDAPEHGLYRAVTHSWFRPANLKLLDDQITAIVDEYLDVIDAAGGELDLVRDVSVWIPLRVVMLILGVPASDAAMMHRLTGELFSPHDPDLARKADAHATAGAAQEFFAYYKSLLAKRRADPTNDLLSVIATATIDSDPIGELEALSYCVSITAAGHDTTAASIAGGVHELAVNLDQYRRVREDPNLIDATVEEIIRFVSPVRSFMRVAEVDYDLRDQRIAAGDAVLLLYPSANRDEAVFDTPNAFSIDRVRNPHLAFGAGPHMCLGMLLARKEIARFLERFVARYAQVQLAGEPSWLKANFLGGLKTLPIRCIRG